MAGKRPTRRKTTRRKPATKRKRRVSGAMPAVVSGTRRKRRKTKVSGLTNNPTMDAVIGVIGSAIASPLYEKFVPIQNAKVKSGLKAILGIAAVSYGAKKKNSLALGFGAGMAVEGITATARHFNVIQGLGDVMDSATNPYDTEDAMIIEMNGLPQQSPMSGPNQIIPIVAAGDNVNPTDSYENDMPAVISYVQQNLSNQDLYG